MTNITLTFGMVIWIESVTHRVTTTYIYLDVMQERIEFALVWIEFRTHVSATTTGTTTATTTTAMAGAGAGALTLAVTMVHRVLVLTARATFALGLAHLTMMILDQPDR